MSTLLQQPEGRPAPAPLAADLAAAGRLIARERAACFLLRACPLIGAALLLAWAGDLVFQLPAGTRLALDLALLLLVGALLGLAARRAWAAAAPAQSTARVLEGRDPALGSKLINILQLEAQTSDARLGPLTRELASQAVARYAGELQGADLRSLARTDAVRRESRRAGWWALGFFTLLLAAFPISSTELQRFADPFGDHPAYSFTHLEISEPAGDGAPVVFNESLLVTVKVGGHRPGELFLSAYPPDHPEAQLTVPMFDKAGHGFSQRLENIRTDLLIYAHTKNRHSTSRRRLIKVERTPRLAGATVRITPPAYTGLPPEQKPFAFKPLKALEGSRLEFRLQSNRPLKEGRIEVIRSPGDLQALAMEPDGENQVRGVLEAREAARLRFSLVDAEGHASQELWEAALGVTHDLPPDIQITQPPGDTFVALDFKLDGVIEGADDYGIKTLRIHRAINQAWNAPRTIDYPKPPLHLREGVSVDFTELGLTPGDTVSFFVEAIDNAPEPHIAHSRTLTLTVISIEDYNAFLRERTDMADIEAKFSGLIAQMRQGAEAQQALGKEIEALAAQSAKADADEKTRAAQLQKLDELLAKQSALNEQLAQLAGKMEEFVRKDPLYDIEAELQKTLQEEAREIRDSLAASAAASKDVAARSAPQEQARRMDAQMLEDFKKASDAQAEKLGATADKAQKDIAEPLEDTALMHEIVKDLNRFKELFGAQHQLAEQSKAYDRGAPLNREDQLALKDFAAREKAIGDELEAVEQKLWEDGKAAQEKFPKAGKSAQDIAQQMGDAKLQGHARKASEAMLSGEGDKSAQLSGRLRDEMAKLFSECKKGEGEMSKELDQAMGLNRGVNPGGSFQQMLKSRKFGQGGKPGFNPGGSQSASGQAMSGSMGGAEASVMGNEPAPSNEARRSGLRGRTQEPGTPPKPPELSGDKPEAVPNRNPLNRESDAVQSESVIDEYSDVVEKYFKAITK